MRIQSPLAVYVLILIALFGYAMPWVITSTTPLTLGAYDLAEWASLHPSQPNTAPALLVPLLLRMQLTILTLIIGLYSTKGTARSIALLSIIVLTVAQLPPLEFITSASDNINYQQQMLLAIFSLVFGILGLMFMKDKFRGSVIIILALSGIGTAIFGLQQALDLYTQSQQEQQAGYGIIIMILAYLGIALVIGRSSLQNPN